MSDKARQNDTVILAVNGTLMRGLELNANLVSVGARFIREAQTCAEYRLYSIDDVHPAMLRVASAGAEISLELWDVPVTALVSVLQNEPAGLCIGKVRLSDGSTVLGVLGEPVLCKGMKEITRFGGWRAYIDSRSSHKAD